MRIIEEIRQLQADAATIALKINHAKTKLMKIGNYSDFSSIMVNDNIITAEQCIKHLGLFIPTDFKFKEHINYLSKRCIGMSVFFTRTIKKLSLRLTVFLTYILPIIEYCSEIFAPVTHCMSVKIEKILVNFLRFLFPNLSSYKARLSYTNLQPLWFRRHIRVLTFVHKCLTHIPLESLPINSTQHQTRNSSNAIRPINVHSLFTRSVPLHRNTRIYNSLPLGIRQTTNLSKFKELASNHFSILYLYNNEDLIRNRFIE